MRDFFSKSPDVIQVIEYLIVADVRMLAVSEVLVDK